MHVGRVSPHQRGAVAVFPLPRSQCTSPKHPVSCIEPGTTTVIIRLCGLLRDRRGDSPAWSGRQEEKALSSRGRGRLRGFLELRRPWGFYPEARRGSQGASRAAPGKSGLHARGEGLAFPRSSTRLSSFPKQGGYTFPPGSQSILCSPLPHLSWHQSLCGPGVKDNPRAHSRHSHNFSG